MYWIEIKDATVLICSSRERQKSCLDHVHK